MAATAAKATSTGREGARQVQDAQRGIGTLAHQELVAVGGVACAYYLSERLRIRTGNDVTVRRVRDLFRNYGGGVRKLGAGYYASRGVEAEPVLDFAERLLADRGALPVDRFVQALMTAYPYGDEYSIRCWLRQRPGRLRVEQGEVALAALLRRAVR